MLETQPQLIEAYVQTGKVRLVYHHLIDFGEPSLRAAVAAECAGEQERFWPMHRALYDRQDAIWQSSDLDATLREIAATVQGLDQQAFAACLSSGRHVEAIGAAHDAAKKIGISQRPTFDLNGQRLVGALPFSQFEQMIERLSGTP